MFFSKRSHPIRISRNYSREQIWESTVLRKSFLIWEYISMNDNQQYKPQWTTQLPSIYLHLKLTKDRETSKTQTPYENKSVEIIRL